MPNKNNLIINVTKPVPRILIINTAPNKWKGCIYLSNSDMTGQVLMFLKDTPSQYSGTFLKKPIFIYSASCRNELENTVIEKTKSLVKKYCQS